MTEYIIGGAVLICVVMACYAIHNAADTGSLKCPRCGGRYLHWLKDNLWFCRECGKNFTDDNYLEEK